MNPAGRLHALGAALRERWQAWRALGRWVIHSWFAPASAEARREQGNRTPAER